MVAGTAGIMEVNSGGMGLALKDKSITSAENIEHKIVFTLNKIPSAGLRVEGSTLFARRPAKTFSHTLLFRSLGFATIPFFLAKNPFTIG